MFTRYAVLFRLSRLRKGFLNLNYVERRWQSTRTGVNKLNIVYENDALSVSQSYIESVLKAYDIQTQIGFTCFKTECKLCSGKMKSTVRNIYVNRTTGYYLCSQCNAQGSWKVLHDAITQVKAQKKPLSDQELERLHFKKVNPNTSSAVLLNKLQSLHELPADGIPDLLKKFNLMPVSVSALKHLNVQLDESQSTLLFPLMTSQERTGYKIIDSSGEEATVPPSGGTGLLIFQPEDLENKGKRHHNSGIVVTSVADAFALINANIVGYHIICLPHGINNLPQEVLPSLEKYAKLVLWFGNANCAWEIAHVFAKKLNEKRCYLIRPTNRGLPPSGAAQAGENLSAIIAEAKPAWVESITTFGSLRENVLFDLQNIQKVDGVKWTRFPMLNTLLKGHRRGELTILTGPTGSGKTTFMSEYTLDLAQKGVNTLWGSFEIPNHRLARTMLTQLAQLPLEKHMEFFDEFADKLDALPLFFLKFHGQQSSKVVMKVVEHATYVHDIAHVVIDTVQFMLGTSEERSSFDRYWIQDLLISSIRSFATEANCHVTLVIHPRKEREGDELQLNSVFGGAKATQEADTVLIIQDSRNSGGGMSLKVAKNRYCGTLGYMPLQFSKNCLSFSSSNKQRQAETDIDKLAKEAGWTTM